MLQHKNCEYLGIGGFLKMNVFIHAVCGTDERVTHLMYYNEWVDQKQQQKGN